MTDSVGAQDLIINRLLDNLPTGIVKSRVKLPNKTFSGQPKIPAAVNESNAVNYCWLAIRIIDTTSESSEATGTLKRTFGSLVIELNWPKNTGNRAAKAVAEQIRKLFANGWLNSLKLGQGTIIDTELSEWYVLDIVFDYYYEGIT